MELWVNQKKDDIKRNKDIKRKKQLKSQLSQLKAERRNYIKTNKKYIKKISLMLRSSTYEKGIERFEELWKIRDELSDEIRTHLKILKDIFMKPFSIL